MRPTVLCPASLLTASVLAAPALAADDHAGDWWNDAVFYEVFVRSFADSSTGPLADDGVGDLAGLIERLDVLKEILSSERKRLAARATLQSMFKKDE